CQRATTVMAELPEDVPFAMIYLLEEDRAMLCGAAGVEAGSAVAPTKLAVGPQAIIDPAWLFGSALELPRVVTGLEAGLRLPGGAWPEPANAAMFLPLLKSGR